VQGTPPDEGLTIFLSYRREDSEGEAGRLFDSLSGRFGDHMFFDVDSIPLGSDFAEEIAKLVAECDVLIAVLGRDWLAALDDDGQRRLDDPADFVRIEIETALARAIPVVPVLVRKARIPKANDLPDSLKPLARRQGIELRGEAWSADVDRLVAGLNRIAGSKQRRALADEGVPSPAGEAAAGHENVRDHEASAEGVIAADARIVRPTRLAPRAPARLRLALEIDLSDFEEDGCIPAVGLDPHAARIAVATRTVTTVLDLATQLPLGHVTTEAVRADATNTGDVALSSDGKLVARAGVPSDAISIWNVETGGLVQDIPVSLGNGPTFTRDGTRIAAIHDSQQVSVWEIASGHAVTNVQAVEGARGFVSCVAFSPGGALLAVGASDGVRVFDVKAGRKIVWIEQDDGYYGAVAVNAASNCVAAAEIVIGEPVSPRIWTLDRGVERARFVHGGAHGVSISPDGSLIAACGDGFWIWDAESGREIAHDDEDFFELVAFSSDAKRIVTASYANAKVWDLQ
jgi:hypothetical protein